MTLFSLTTNTFVTSAFSYLERLQGCFDKTNLEAIENLAHELRKAWIDGRINIGKIHLQGGNINIY